MGWQQRSSDKYNSASGHAFCIGGCIRKKLDYRVKSRVDNVFNRAIWYKKPIKQHSCPKNHVTGSSKEMDPDAGVESMVDADSCTLLSILQSSVIMIHLLELFQNGPIKNYQIYSLSFNGQEH